MSMERLTHERVNGIKTGYWSAATKETLVQRLAVFENEEERRAMGPRTIFEKITASPEVLGNVLTSLSAPEAPWDDAFREIYCAGCGRENCDACPHEEYRNNPAWWLGLEAT